MESKREKSIFKGNYETQLIMGKATYNKIQFREVTSYFKNGWVYFVVSAKPLPFNYSSS